MQNARMESFVRDDPEMKVLDEHDGSTHTLQIVDKQRADRVELLVTILTDDDVELTSMLRRGSRGCNGPGERTRRSCRCVAHGHRSERICGSTQVKSGALHVACERPVDVAHKRRLGVFLDATSTRVGQVDTMFRDVHQAESETSTTTNISTLQDREIQQEI